jgi:hypothetical protein
MDEVSHILRRYRADSARRRAYDATRRAVDAAIAIDSWWEPERNAQSLCG